MFSQKKITGSRQTAARLTASWNVPCATAPSPKNATATLPSRRSCAAVAAPTAIGRPAPTIPLAPKMPIVGSAMCIEPPRPRFVPASLPISSANIPSAVETLREAVAVAAVGRRDHVGRAERPARADGRRLLPDRQVHEARHLAVAVQRRDALLEPADHEHPPMHLEEVGVAEHEPCIVLIGTNSAEARRTERAMPEQIDIPASFAGVGDVAGKRVVITGAGRGLGRLLAHAFSQGGARVALVARTETDLKAVADELPGASLVLAGDVTDAEFNEAVADATVAEWGGVDVWICNAGISPILAGPRKTDPSVWREILDVNLTGAFLGARAAARVMRDGGRLIFTGSVLGERPREGLAAYSASKAGLVGLAKGLALDLAAAGITVNVVAPGWFDSPLAERWKNSPELGAGVLGHTAQRRWGASTDLAGAYQFLASDASAFVTGTVLNVDGGYLLV